MAKRPNKKFGLEFDGFEELLTRINKLEGNAKATTDRALKATHKHITPTLHQAMAKHRQTEKTEKSIVDTAKVEWIGSVASVEVGFDISKGGLPSIFLMFGTPKMKPDTKLKNAIFGNKTRSEIMKIQEDIFYDEIRRLNG